MLSFRKYQICKYLVISNKSNIGGEERRMKRSEYSRISDVSCMLENGIADSTIVELSDESSDDRLISEKSGDVRVFRELWDKVVFFRRYTEFVSVSNLLLANEYSHVIRYRIRKIIALLGSMPSRAIFGGNKEVNIEENPIGIR